MVPFLPGVYYHIYNRGNNRQPIFFQHENYQYFLNGLRRYVRPAASMIAYCLMPTHYHLLVRVERTKSSALNSDAHVSVASERGFSTSGSQDFSLAMQRLTISYTKAINTRFSRVGALFQGAFRSKPIRTYEYLLNLCIYIHANPVKDGLAASPDAWLYSNYCMWIGEEIGVLYDPVFINGHFPSIAEYKSLVLRYIQTRCLPDDVSHYLDVLEK